MSGTEGPYPGFVQVQWDVRSCGETEQQPHSAELSNGGHADWVIGGSQQPHSLTPSPAWRKVGPFSPTTIPLTSPDPQFLQPMSGTPQEEISEEALWPPPMMCYCALVLTPTAMMIVPDPELTEYLRRMYLNATPVDLAGAANPRTSSPTLIARLL